LPVGDLREVIQTDHLLVIVTRPRWQADAALQFQLWIIRRGDLLAGSASKFRPDLDEYPTSSTAPKIFEVHDNETIIGIMHKFSELVIARLQPYIGLPSRLIEFSIAVIGLPSQAPLPDSNDRYDPRAEDCPFGNRTICAFSGCFLFFVSVVLLNYGIANIYDGPTDWRGPASLWVGFIPFAAGFLIFAFCVFSA
jgi:hypothetical protein